MAATALAISVLALAVSVVAAIYARKEANATAEMRDHDAERRREERTPRLTVAVVDHERVTVTLAVVLEGPDGLDACTVAPGASGAISKVEPADLGPLRIGQAIEVVANRAAVGEGGVGRLVITCRRGPESWTIYREVEIPPEVAVVAFYG